MDRKDKKKIKPVFLISQFKKYCKGRKNPKAPDSPIDILYE